MGAGRRHPRRKRRLPQLITTPLSSLLLGLFAHYTDAQSTTSTSSSSPSSSPQCDCYLISGPEPSYYTYHQFFDFRNLHTYANSYIFPNGSANPPEIVAYTASAGTEPSTSDYFTSSSSPWTQFWTITNATGLYNYSTTSTAHGGSAYEQVATLQNVWISPPDHDGDGDDEGSAPNSTYLALRTARNRAFQSVAEISTQETQISHASVRARLCLLGSNDSTGEQSAIEEGAVFGMFTYASDTQESDLEILSRESSRQFHATNQPDVDDEGNVIPYASDVVQLPLAGNYTSGRKAVRGTNSSSGISWANWTDFRLDWNADATRWWADGVLLLNKTVNVPKKPSAVLFNVWGDGGDWSGEMTVGRDVVVGIEWIEIVYNVSGKGGSGHCHVGCYVDSDEVKDTGTPAVAFNSSSAASLLGTGSSSWTGLLWMNVLPLVIAIVLWQSGLGGAL
jgi:hypothetical protein